MLKDLTGGINGGGICSRIGTSPSSVKRSRIYWNWCVSAPGARVYINAVCNYARDKGWPLGVGLQEQVSNHLKLHRSRAVVVSGGVWTVTSFLQNMLPASGRYEAHVNLLATSFGDPASVRLLSPLTWLRGPQIFTADGGSHSPLSKIYHDDQNGETFSPPWVHRQTLLGSYTC